MDSNPAVVQKAEHLVREAEALISEILRPGRWPRAATVERFLEGNRLERVLSLYSAAMESHPSEPSYPWNLASTLSRLGLNDLALAFIERALRVGRDVDPDEWDTPGSYLAWADTAIAAGQYDVALIPIAHALRANGSDPALVESARKLVREIGRKKQIKDPPAELAEELRKVPN